ncbi:tRNA (adenosine(37)-N6)-threonylcarbamoyltransferase complex ATPase subunit type 1 TsaE [Aquaticitalea lipolytica]|uniref:tRNA threonylcarbamoyladenosine biosynthesis protein TsaE n=1 Tax=Aquaticitalea lipolytica TaxID=1247562 RepID=A0A8J2TPY5_9FLAO|nr:tRNA (adenosine(37)-N6)-threonylcarbamoyltransferase complex ATPase subunit type 1 TsaE [Aquaticitalea lipolytica]GFZ85228.1 tRNA (adenosine(37)-N6)-threonylcarbamoyltransferase complex ATPase subunit type 1 TsaE [Aquaticitalea lipolytica]
MEITYNIQDITTVAEAVIKQLTSKTILMYGDMGVGKTTFIKSFVKALKSDDDVTSPTFSIVNEYVTPSDKVFHFDLYRIKDENEALQFGIEDYLYSNNWIIIEWPDRIENLYPNNANTITITQNKDNSRTLKLSHNISLTQQNAIKLQKTE